MSAYSLSVISLFTFLILVGFVIPRLAWGASRKRPERTKFLAVYMEDFRYRRYRNENLR
jgi:hypothetical protein